MSTATRPGGATNPRRQQGIFGGQMGMSLPPEKARDFKGTMRRMLRRLRPERFIIAVVLVLGVTSVFFAVIGPKLLGNATNIIFEGIVGRQLPAGTTQAQAEAFLRSTGRGQQADMLSGMTVTPGEGVDFTALGNVIALVAVVYLLSSLFSWGQNYLMAGVTQRVMFRLREEVDLKLGRLPLKYFDEHARGDLLSRVTNDIDNISMTLQQTLTQLITSVLTVFGVLIMMVLISPLLAIISLLTVPL
ncbi:MAG: ABC transporter ATP-binding protein, partial [Actinomycetes bacterium]